MQDLTQSGVLNGMTRKNMLKFEVYVKEKYNKNSVWALLAAFRNAVDQKLYTDMVRSLNPTWEISFSEPK
jgi:hypothetical protein